MKFKTLASIWKSSWISLLQNIFWPWLIPVCEACEQSKQLVEWSHMKFSHCNFVRYQNSQEESALSTVTHSKIYRITVFKNPWESRKHNGTQFFKEDMFFLRETKLIFFLTEYCEGLGVQDKNWQKTSQIYQNLKP